MASSTLFWNRLGVCQLEAATQICARVCVCACGVGTLILAYGGNAIDGPTAEVFGFVRPIYYNALDHNGQANECASSK